MIHRRPRLPSSLLLALLAVLGPALCGAQPSAPAPELLHVGFSMGLTSELNKTDAMASIDVWGSSLASDRGVSMKAVSEVFEGQADLNRAVRSGSVDLVAVRVEEYFALGAGVSGAALFVCIKNGNPTEEYVLVARRASKPTLMDLKGKTLVVQDGSRSGLARPWLDTLLASSGQPPSERFFGSVATVTKASRAVLPVFFGQKDACLVTRSGLRTMAELNPQVGRDLEILATSPPVVPHLLMLTPSFTRPLRATVTQALLGLDQSPRGQQLLNLFGSDRLLPASEADLAGARRMYDAYLRSIGQVAR